MLTTFLGEGMPASDKMTRTRIPSSTHPAAGPRALTLRLDPEPSRQLALLAAAENRSPTNYVETLVLREIQARSEDRRVLRMRVAPEAVDLDPGPLLRGEDEPDQRYAERKALFDELLGLPDTD
jgi:hypothetical protein